MKITKIKKFAIWILLLASVQFVTLTLIAMIIYPGGTLHSPDLTTYSFSRNYFSDLGRTQNFLNVDNNISSTLFTLALSIVGTAMGIFFVTLPTLFKNKRAIGLAIGAAICGLFSGYCFIEVAARPWDIDFLGHVKYTRAGFLSFFVCVVLYAIAVFNEKFYANKYGIALTICSVIMGFQIILMFFGPKPFESEWALFLQAISQKIVVYSEILTLGYITYGLIKDERYKTVKRNVNINVNVNA